MTKNCLRSCLAWVACLPRGLGGFGKDVCISISAEISFAQRIFLGNNVFLHRHSRLYANGESACIKIGDYTNIYPYALLKTDGGRIEIGKACSVHDYCLLYGFGNIIIADDVHIAAHAVIVASEHPYEKLGTLAFSREVSGKGIKIEKSVWIGASVVILDGVTIGEGSVIGAGSVVTKDIPPYSVAVGVPARVIKTRSSRHCEERTQ